MSLYVVTSTPNSKDDNGKSMQYYFLINTFKGYLFFYNIPT